MISNVISFFLPFYIKNKYEIYLNYIYNYLAYFFFIFWPPLNFDMVNISPTRIYSDVFFFLNYCLPSPEIPGLLNVEAFLLWKLIGVGSINFDVFPTLVLHAH